MGVQKEVEAFLPHGSGFDAPWKIEFPPYDGVAMQASSSYHLMDDNGGYACWLDFTVTLHGNGYKTIEFAPETDDLQDMLDADYGEGFAPDIAHDEISENCDEILAIIRKTGKAI